LGELATFDSWDFFDVLHLHTVELATDGVDISGLSMRHRTMIYDHHDCGDGRGASPDTSGTLRRCHHPQPTVRRSARIEPPSICGSSILTVTCILVPLQK
jgi:hypothetical protein